MSRIRTIKPEFWTSEQVISCSPLARLLFIGMFNFCDDHGVHPASYIRIKAEVFPIDAFSSEEIKCWINELIDNDLLREYTVNKKIYWIVTGWKKHQRIDRPTYRHPLPLTELVTLEDTSSNIHGLVDESFSSVLGVVDDNSTTTQQIVDELSTTDRNGMERIGKEKDIREVNASPCVVLSKDSLVKNEVQEIFQYWQSTLSHSQARLDAKRRRKIVQSLKDYSVEDLKRAIDGCAKTPFNMGENDRKQRYDDIELILRDASHIDRFIHNANNPPNSFFASMAAADLMAGVL